MNPSERNESWLARGDLQRLLDALASGGFRVLGPVARDGAVVLDTVRSIDELPVGLRDVQAPGRYRLEKDGSDRVFGVVNGPGGLKPLSFAPRESLLQIETAGLGQPFTARATVPAPEKIAVVGVRACDLAGLAMQDRIFLHDRYPDPYYASRRQGLLLVAVSCTRSAPTCFCTSMGTGPEAVCDAHLRVRGIAGLRVADASVMPRIVGGNTNAAAIMIGEKAADLIRES